MKLFNAIAAAAVISTSFIAPNPAEARNGWIYDGADGQGRSVYVRKLGCAGNICRFQLQIAGTSPTTFGINCNSWTISNQYGTTQEIMPGSRIETKANQMCR